MGAVWTLVVLSAVAVPVVLVWLFVRKPYDRGSVPRDAMSVRAKGKLQRPGAVLTSEAFDDIRDDAADLSEPTEQVPE